MDEARDLRKGEHPSVGERVLVWDKWRWVIAHYMRYGEGNGHFEVRHGDAHIYLNKAYRWVDLPQQPQRCPEQVQAPTLDSGRSFY